VAIGSEEALRANSQKALKTADAKSSGVFDRRPFEQFTSRKFKEMLKNPKLLDKYMKDLEHEVELKKVREHDRLLR
jgi:hypothetical protein